MSVSSGQVITVEFTTRNFNTGVAQNADYVPTGVLVVNGTDTSTVVIVNNISVGRYSMNATIPTIGVGVIVELVASASVSGVVDSAVIWNSNSSDGGSNSPCPPCKCDTICPCTGLLTTIELVQSIPGMQNQSPAFLTNCIGWASRAVQTFLKREICKQTYTEFRDGNYKPDIVLRHYPVYVDPTFAVYFDPQGYYGQAPISQNYTPFAPNTQLILGQQFALVLDNTPFGLNPYNQPVVSNRGIIRMIGGFGTGIYGYGFGWFGYGYGSYGGKLAGTKLPCWPFCYGGIKAVYNAGFDCPPQDIQFAVSLLVAYMVRTMPQGGPLSSESLGNYSYSIAQIALQTNPPELGSVARTLAPHREVSFGI